MSFIYPHRTPGLLKKIIPSAVWQIPNNKKEIYLTFDDGPHPEITPWVLDLLDKYNQKATFFCVGHNVQKYPQVYNMIIQRGHVVANHTFNHLNGWKNKTPEYIQNIAECRELVNSNLFRPPYGKINKSQIALLKSEYKIIMWSLLSGDFSPNLNPEMAKNKLMELTRAGDIVVFHDSIKAEKNLQSILPAYLEFLSIQNFSCVCLG